MSYRDLSSTITSGGTAQTRAAADGTRLGFSVQNKSTGDLYVKAGGTAASATVGWKIGAGELLRTSPGMQCGGALSIFGATTGQAFEAGEWN